MNLLNITDIQFQGNDVTTQKLRRLVADVQKAEAALNTLINAVTELEAEGGDIASFLFANPTLQSTFQVEGLAPNQVLQALTSTSAAFKALTLEQLSDIVLSTPVDGQVLTRFHGQWINQSVPGSTPPVGENLGSGIGIYAGISGGNLAFYSIQGDGVTVSVSLVGQTLVLSAIGGASLTFAQVSAVASMRL